MRNADAACGNKGVNAYERFDVGPTRADSDTDTAYRYGYLYGKSNGYTYSGVSIVGIKGGFQKSQI